jgi:hypothetical protein
MARQSDGLQELAEGLVYRLDFVDAVVLFALLKRGPQLLALELARVIACCAELEGLAEECQGAAQEIPFVEREVLVKAPASRNAASVSKTRTTLTASRSAS